MSRSGLVRFAVVVRHHASGEVAWVGVYRSLEAALREGRRAIRLARRPVTAEVTVLHGGPVRAALLPGGPEATESWEVTS